MEFLSNLSTWEIVGIIALVLIFGGFVWRVAKRLVVILFIAAAVILGIYFTKPEILYDWFGKDNVDKVEVVVKDKTEEAQEVVKEKTTEVVKELDSN